MNLLISRPINIQLCYGNALYRGCDPKYNAYGKIQYFFLEPICFLEVSWVIPLACKSKSTEVNLRFIVPIQC